MVSGSYKICVDLTNGCSHQLGDVKVFATLDVTAAFLQVQLSQECKAYTT